jgi:hypothetical protein
VHDSDVANVVVEQRGLHSVIEVVVVADLIISNYLCLHGGVLGVLEQECVCPPVKEVDV